MRTYTLHSSFVDALYNLVVHNVCGRFARNAHRKMNIIFMCTHSFLCAEIYKGT